jgi:hypothetical protein
MGAPALSAGRAVKLFCSSLMRYLASICLCLVSILVWRPQAAEAVTIELDYSYDGSGFFNDPQRKATLEAAAAAWEQVLQGVTLPEIPLGTGINTWTLSFNRPDQAATFEQEKNTAVVNKPVPANTIVIYVGARPDVYGGFLGYAEFEYSAFGTSAWLELFTQRNNNDQFYSFGGAVSFDSDADWHFDPVPSSKEDFAGQMDFYTIALHEIGHLLGFTPDVAVYRRKTMGSNFFGANATALYGSAPPIGGGGHWPDDFEFDGKGMVMAAILQPNVRNEINPLEVAILRDLGYVQKGQVQVTLGPAAAVTGGARWRLDEGPEQISGAVLSTGEGVHTLSFKAVPGFVKPADQTITVVSGETLEVAVNYSAIPLPSIVQVPASQWVRVGQSVTLQVEAEADEAEIAYQWQKNGTAIKNAKSAAVTLTNVGVAAAGIYGVRVSTAVGAAVPMPTANLGVIGAVSGPLAVNEGGTLTLNQTAAGPGISYQWLRDGQPLVNDLAAGVSGVDRAKLVIKNVTTVAAGVYACRLTMADAAGGAALEQLGPEQPVSITLRPIVNELVLGPWRVGGSVTDLVTAQNGATRFAIRGLPAGVILNPTTGQLSGRPQVARTYSLSITASNAAGRSGIKVVPVVCEDFAGKAQGGFDGLIARSPLNAELGGWIKCTVARSGALSGQLTVGRVRHRFSGGMETLPGPNPTATLTIPRGRTQPALTLNLAFDAATGAVTGTLTDGVQPAAAVTCRRNPWHLRNQPATAWSGTYTAAIQPVEALGMNGGMDEATDLVVPEEAAIPPEPLLIPRGAGFVTAKVAASGLVSWSGRLADGAAFTWSSTLSEDGLSSLHTLLYGGTGSAQGWNQWQAPAAEETEVTLDGSLDWFKYVQLSTKVTNYRAGFPLHDLSLSGGRYQPPAAGERVLGITDDPQRNAGLRFSQGGIELAALGAAASIDFTLTTAHKGVLLPAAENPAQTRLTRLVASSGAFQGTFVLQDARPGGGTTLTRRVTYFGLVVPRLGKGFGYFLLPELTALTPVPLLSGQVLLEKVPPLGID